MSIFAIADLHLSFAPDSDKPMDVFGERWKNHPERIRENWCSLVSEEDTVVVAGDISWGLKLSDAVYDLDWVDDLPGHKVMLKGNHDLWWSGINRMNAMYDSITFLQNDAYRVTMEDGKDVWICGSRGWLTPDDDDFNEADEKIYKREILRLRASLDFARSAAEDAEAAEPADVIGFLHYPPSAKPGMFSGFMQAFEDYGVKEVYYGHIHGEEGCRAAVQGEYYGTEYRLISADYLNFRPVTIR